MTQDKFEKDTMALTLYGMEATTRNRILNTPYDSLAADDKLRKVDKKNYENFRKAAKVDGTLQKLSARTVALFQATVAADPVTYASFVASYPGVQCPDAAETAANGLFEG